MFWSFPPPTMSKTTHDMPKTSNFLFWLAFILRIQDGCHIADSICLPMLPSTCIAIWRVSKFPSCPMFGLVPPPCMLPCMLITVYGSCMWLTNVYVHCPHHLPKKVTEKPSVNHIGSSTSHQWTLYGRIGASYHKQCDQHLELHWLHHRGCQRHNPERHQRKSWSYFRCTSDRNVHFHGSQHCRLKFCFLRNLLNSGYLTHKQPSIDIIRDTNHSAPIAREVKRVLGICLFVNIQTNTAENTYTRSTYVVRKICFFFQNVSAIRISISSSRSTLNVLVSIIFKVWMLSWFYLVQKNSTDVTHV